MRAIVLYPEFYVPQPFKWCSVNTFQQFPWIHEYSIFSQRWKESSSTVLKAWSGFANHFGGGSPFSREVSTGPADWDASPGPTKSLGNNLILGETTCSRKAPRTLSKLAEPTLQQKSKLWIPACSREGGSARKWGKQERVRKCWARSSTGKVSN